MKIGKTELRLNADIEKRGALFAVLLDPDTSDEAAFVKAGSMAAENGADLLLVGGSYLGNFTLPKQVAALKAAVDLPVILFPGGASQVVPGFDAMLFMIRTTSLTNRCAVVLSCVHSTWKQSRRHTSSLTVASARRSNTSAIRCRCRPTSRSSAW